MKSYKLKQNFIDLDIKQIMVKHKNQEQDFRKNKSVMTRPLIKNVLEEIEKRCFIINKTRYDTLDL